MRAAAGYLDVTLSQGSRFKSLSPVAGERGLGLSRLMLNACMYMSPNESKCTRWLDRTAIFALMMRSTENQLCRKQVCCAIDKISLSAAVLRLRGQGKYRAVKSLALSTRFL